MALRTDLAIENSSLANKNVPEGVTLDSFSLENILVETVTIISEQGEKSLNKPKGKYITITTPSFEGNTTLSQQEHSHIAKELSSLLPEKGTVLVVGLGNIHITPDAIGPKTVDLILATRHMTETALKPLEGFRSVAAIAPGVLGQTGLETSEIIFSVVQEIKPNAIIAIDALASGSIDRLGKTIQISDTGISPGAGVQNRRKELSAKTLGIPVIAVGVPTVVDGRIIASEISDVAPQEIKGEPMMVTPRDIDLLVDRSSKTLAMCINLALQENLSQEDIIYLTC